MDSSETIIRISNLSNKYNSLGSRRELLDLYCTLLVNCQSYGAAVLERHGIVFENADKDA
jgi:hypothetical protein